MSLKASRLEVFEDITLDQNIGLKAFGLKAAIKSIIIIYYFCRSSGSKLWLKKGTRYTTP